MTKRIKLRTLLMGGFFTLLFVGLIFRIYWVQVGPASAMWAENARETWMTSKTIPQERGKLLDRDGKVLAADAAAYTIAVGPKKIADLDKENPDWRVADRIVSKLHIVLGTPESQLRAMIGAKKQDGTYLDQKEIRPDGWKVDAEVKDRLDKFREELKTLTKKKDVGLYFVEEQKRYYPNGSLAAHILGYTNKDGQAVLGLEKKMDDVLKGSPGFIQYEKDNTGAQLPNGQVKSKPAVDGKDVTLTLDRDIQFYIEEALKEAYDKYHPVSITAVAADPKTMDILGMASLPSFDPNQYWTTKDQANFKDNAIMSVYEPGSTFKIVTLAAAVQEGLFNPNEMYKSGGIKVPGKVIHDYNYTGWGEISYLDGLKHSSNVAFVHLGYEKLGAVKLRSYIDAFGFGQRTNIGLPGESPGSISFHNNIPTEVATAAFGQGLVQVTPIQQVAAVAAVANGGKLMQPRLIKSISDASGTKQVFEPKVIRQVISAETSRKVGDYLETVVSDQKIGTGKNAYIPGYRIAGKTGTAQKVIDGSYSADKYVVSFIGYAPVEDPKIVLYVIVDEPQSETAGGGSVAAPIFKKIMEKSLRHLGIAPNLPDTADKDAQSAAVAAAKAADVTASVPDVTGMTPSQAKTELGRRSFDAKVLGKGTKVIQQLPKSGSMLPTSQQVYLLTDANAGEVPDLKGLSLRDAMEMCSLLKASCTVQGEGYVLSQEVTQVNGKTTVKLTLAPPEAVQSTAEEEPSPSTKE
ncbi:penicillin-binding transpeptidase domain-containing protein [Cohnella candidum]|uniref:PASTA domain-containing protein n=1 Tax=Cohnella candidum TaxID=2674991 RepID=A0A3G3JU77_9BACL|nr:penicillin-binding transpeptidase domain-containing protein [Cohnella candidum]AYQ71798.1 PASTA domain-containing protein [Cohnella candidum]